MKPVTPRAVVEIIDRIFGDAAKNQQDAWDTAQRRTDFSPIDAPTFGPAIAAPR